MHGNTYFLQRCGPADEPLGLLDAAVLRDGQHGVHGPQAVIEPGVGAAGEGRRSTTAADFLIEFEANWREDSL